MRRIVEQKQSMTENESLRTELANMRSIKDELNDKLLNTNSKNSALESKVDAQ